MTDRPAPRCLYCGMEMKENRKEKYYGCPRCESESPRADSPEDAYAVRHARWEYFKDTGMWGCSDCKARITRNSWEGEDSFCRNCGARMDAEEEKDG